MMFGDPGNSRFESHRHVESRSLRRRPRFASSPAHTHGPAQFLQKKLTFLFKLLDPSEVIELPRFLQFLTQLLEAVLIGGFGLRIEQFACVSPCGQGGCRSQQSGRTLRTRNVWWRR